MTRFQPRSEASAGRGNAGRSTLRALAALLAATSAACAAPGADERAEEEVAAQVQALTLPPDLACVPGEFGGRDYWFCPTLRSWQTARSKCQSVGLDLVRVDSSAENQYLLSKLAGNTWIGGTDATVEGAWRWTDGNTQFWQGKASGSATGGAYTQWKTGQPDDLLNQDCLIFWGGLGAGKWSDESCATLAVFVCEGDKCPLDPNKTAPGQCGCGVPDTDGDGDGVANCVDGCPSSAGKSIPGQCGCSVAETDSDADGSPDCVDQCPSDPAKTRPGVCGCGSTDADADGDGTPTCNDECPNDKAKVFAGDCGCADAPRPAGTACDDGLCSANAVCSATGTCGSATQCGTPDSACTFGARAGSGYWYCSNDRSFADARQRCQSVGMDLAVVQSAGEDAFISSRISEHTFVGASDQATEGQFFWLAPNTKFWTGGRNGSPVGGAYTNWESGQPYDDALHTRDCVVKDPPIGGGKWETNSCSLGEAYVCETVDACPSDPGKTRPGLCGCGVTESDLDTDGDGTLDCLDDCPRQATKTDPGQCGCTQPDQGDSDGDGTYDCADSCPTDPNKASPVLCPCGVREGRSSDLSVRFDCVYARTDGSKAAVFTVTNSHSCRVEVARGSQNVLVGAAEQGQPTVFEAGAQRLTMLMPENGTVKWTLGSSSATASWSGPTCTDVVEESESPVDLDAVYHPAVGTPAVATGSSATGLSFEIPPFFSVRSGNAGNGITELSYVKPTGETVTCTYRGGASVASPTTRIDRARGHYYEFQSCSNGAHARDRVVAVRWTTRILGADPQWPRTSIEQPVGGGCDELLEAPFSPAQTVQMQEAFNWTSTTVLAQTDDHGFPALRYALLYVERQEQLDQLKAARVYYRARPIFSTDLNRYKGHCGDFDMYGDGRGVFVFSLIPATVYNLWRDRALSVLNGAPGDIPFRAIVLPQIPEASLRNADGTLSWQAIKASGFDYFAQVYSAQSFSWGFDDLVEAVGDGLEALWEGGTGLVGGVDQFFSGSVNVRLDFDVITNDRAFFDSIFSNGVDPSGLFTWPMRRGWGPNRGEVAPKGAEAEIIQWAAGFLPGAHFGTLDALGRTTIKVAKGSGPRDGGMCVHLENHAAMISDGITEDEHCNFSSVPWDNFNHDVPSGGGRLQINVSHSRWRALTQATDGWDYMQRVVGHEPTQAEIGVGWFANFVGSLNNDRPSTLCLDFGFSADYQLAVFTSLVPAVSLPVWGAAQVAESVASPWLEKDMFLMDHSEDDDGNEITARWRRSRATVTHEYGHYVECDLIWQQDGTSDLAELYLARAFEGGGTDDRDQHVTVGMEMFADFFSMQVAGGASYAHFPPDQVRSSQGMQYCDHRNPRWLDCIEANAQGRNEADPDSTFNDEVSRWLTMVHDAYDGRGDRPRSQDWPTNSDPWENLALTEASGTTRNWLVWSDRGYLSSEEWENVALPGSSIKDWIDVTAANGGYDYNELFRGFTSSMYGQGVTWCAACEIMAMHHPDWSRQFVAIEEMYNICTSDGLLSSVLGPPPDADLRLEHDTCEVCPLHQWSGYSKFCLACDSPRDVVIHNGCQTCPAHFIAAPNGESCDMCAGNEIATAENRCQACPSGQGPAVSTDTCVACGNDKVIHWPAAPTPDCHFERADVLSGGGADCLDQFWFDVEDLNVIAASGAHPSSLKIALQGTDIWSATECVSHPITVPVDLELTLATGIVRSEHRTATLES